MLEARSVHPWARQQPYLPAACDGSYQGIPSTHALPASNTERVIIEIPATGERIEAQLVQDSPNVPLSITLVESGLTYVLAALLKLGWRIVESTPAPNGTSWH